MSAARGGSPYRAATRAAINRVGVTVDADLAAHGANLTHGCEPTFVSAAGRDAAEWNHAALGPQKRAAGEALLLRLRARWAPHGLMLAGQGKHYPGEPLPRWALGLFWLTDGVPVWTDAGLNALGRPRQTTDADAAPRFAAALATALGLDTGRVIPAYEDPWQMVDAESRLPVDVDPHVSDLGAGAERARLARLLRRDVAAPAGYVLPLWAANSPNAGGRWRTRDWRLRRERLYTLPGDSALGYRLPLDSLASVNAAEGEENTALAIELRQGRLHVFLPPLARLDDYLALVAAIERTARQRAVAVVPEGVEPPPDERLVFLRVTPDPGVLEVNLHPAASWPELAERITTLYEEAAQVGLTAEKYQFDGRRVGTGGGCHMTFGGPTPRESPFVQRPDLLCSLVAYWQNHPSLSYLFAGLFIGPTSQAPRIDEAREDALYEVEIAFQHIARRQTESSAAQQIDALLAHLLVDVTGNAHRSEFCIDKLHSAANPGGCQGLLELRAFEMAPHADMSLVEALLVRAAAAMFWRKPYHADFVRWGTALHDRFMLPHFLAIDLDAVLADLKHAGYAFERAWFAPFFEFRCPSAGEFEGGGVRVTLRHALEPWPVLGDTGGTSRPVDSSLERFEIKATGMDPARHAVVCNGRRVSLEPTGAMGEFVAGVRFRAWHYEGARHPGIAVHAPLTFDIVETATGRSLGACEYHVTDRAGAPYAQRPTDARAAAARRAERFAVVNAAGRTIEFAQEPANPWLPLTLDLRYGQK
ncbi:MAG: transglutaminase family protein [Betaproteobacteria bacterium]|nr:transglutaminase family protein [Betaproteobacteria bacterium]